MLEEKYKLTVSVFNMGTKYYENSFVFDDLPTEKDIEETRYYVGTKCKYGSMEMEVTKFWKV